MKSIITLLLLIFIVAPFSFAQDLELELFASNLDSPVNIKHGGDDKLYVVEQAGYIRIINTNGTINATPFLDIDNIVINTGNERGLLGLAFHPNYATNGYLFVYYINNSGNTVISRFTRNATNPLIADSNSEFIILTYTQPYSNHNGGDLAFGSDGYLYVSSGDGGSGGDPQDNSQNTLSLLGKILRLDINSTTAAQNYSIPDSNPFVGDSNSRGEIWAYGLRNAWKFSFDRLNGDVWIADVGQNAYEEINHVSAADAAAGLNYGWRCYEGDAPYNSTDCSAPSFYTFPIDVYSHSGDGQFKCSITGGYRYRGTEFSAFDGWYFFADYCSGEIGYLVYNEIADTWNRTFDASFNGNWSAFGEDINGELYVCDISSGNIYKIVDTALSIDDNSFSKISIYPNPTKNILNINFGSNSVDLLTEIAIYDIQGKIVKAIRSTSENFQQVNTSELSDGLYVLKINLANGNQSTHKLVIN